MIFNSIFSHHDVYQKQDLIYLETDSIGKTKSCSFYHWLTLCHLCVPFMEVWLLTVAILLSGELLVRLQIWWPAIEVVITAPILCQLWSKCVFDLILRVSLHWRESESDVASRWVHRQSNLMFTLSNDKDQRKNFIFAQCKWTLKHRILLTSCILRHFLSYCLISELVVRNSEAYIVAVLFWFVVRWQTDVVNALRLLFPEEVVQLDVASVPAINGEWTNTCWKRSPSATNLTFYQGSVYFKSFGTFFFL